MKLDFSKINKNELKNSINDIVVYKYFKADFDIDIKSEYIEFSLDGDTLKIMNNLKFNFYVHSDVPDYLIEILSVIYKFIYYALNIDLGIKNEDYYKLSQDIDMREFDYSEIIGNGIEIHQCYVIIGDSLKIFNDFHCEFDDAVYNKDDVVDVAYVFSKVIIEIYENSHVISDDAVKPNYYLTKDGAELFDILKNSLLTDLEYRGALKFNIYKYLFRYHYKNGTEDLKKAKSYLNNLIEFEEGERYE